MSTWQQVKLKFWKIKKNTFIRIHYNCLHGVKRLSQLHECLRCKADGYTCKTLVHPLTCKIEIYTFDSSLSMELEQTTGTVSEHSKSLPTVRLPTTRSTVSYDLSHLFTTCTTLPDGKEITRYNKSKLDSADTHQGGFGSLPKYNSDFFV